MSSSDSFNFGRKIKELKKTHKKGYVDLTAGLKISRERIIQLEENEREPNDTERRRFANFYNLPPEEFGLVEGSGTPPPPTPRPAPNYNNYNAPSYQGGDRQGGFQGDRRPGGYTGGSGQRPGPGGPGGGQRPGPGGGQRPGPGGPGGGQRPGPGGGQRPGPGGNGMRQDQAPPKREPSEPKEPKAPKEPKEPKVPENKPIMKYTAEQLGDIESAYLRKQRDLKVPLTFTFLNGKQYTGVVTDFTPFTIHIQDVETGQEVILRKLSMSYYRKAESPPSPRSGSSDSEKPEPEKE